MASYPNLKIFIVDDDLFCLNLYQQFLLNLGYINITAFTAGDDCLQQIKEQPALVFMDYNMEGMNGIELLKKIKGFDSHIMVYIISGQEIGLVAKESLQYGALDYVLKSSLSPEKMNAIMKRVEQYYTPHRSKEGKRSFFEKVKSGLGM
ncbi:histidine kinase [Niastella yeongjuensis]|uniref:Histidine kinase n=2 Tax=Niastella yeongjuensis TaxID=354355 RepID=A0A1V9EP68_9BACT|nr:histidine kinase [Niastella yeongjuensis]SEP47972.1 Response regulator receiver domain-containing protein [Niastella yeongjuensis]